MLTSRRLFLGGLLAAVAAPAIALPFRVDNLINATQSMVEGAIAQASAFDLQSICWTARFNIYQHTFDVVGRSQERTLELALAAMVDEANSFRVMPSEMAQRLTDSYGRFWKPRHVEATIAEVDLEATIAEVDLVLTPEQMGLVLERSLVPQYRQSIQGGASVMLPDLAAARGLQQKIDRLPDRLNQGE